jgi:hypothetical protein
MMRMMTWMLIMKTSYSIDLNQIKSPLRKAKQSLILSDKIQEIHLKIRGQRGKISENSNLRILKRIQGQIIGIHKTRKLRETLNLCLQKEEEMGQIKVKISSRKM